MAARGSALDSAKPNGLLSGKRVAGDNWIGVLPCISELQREATRKFSCFRQKQLSIKGIESIAFFDMKNRLPLLTASAWESLRAFQNHLFSSHRGIYSVIERSMNSFLCDLISLICLFLV